MGNTKQQYLQYYYSVILNIELHCCKYCKKIIIFYYVEREERWKRIDIILRYIILLCRYIILMSKRGKQKFEM